MTSLPRATRSRFVVGRSTRANLCVPDVAWSREQFAIQVEPGACYLEQLSQKVPTLVNGARLDGRRAEAPAIDHHHRDSTHRRLLQGRVVSPAIRRTHWAPLVSIATTKVVSSAAHLQLV